MKNIMRSLFKTANVISLVVILSTISCKDVIVDPEPTPVDTTKVLADYATASYRSALLPKQSDVIMRSLRFRPYIASDIADGRYTRGALTDFHVTRLEWTYISNLNDAQAADSIKRVIAMGRLFGGTINIDVDNKYCNVDLNGEVIAPEGTLVNPKANGCLNNPDFFTLQTNEFVRNVNAGALSNQRDDPSTTANAWQDGGCFCNYCMDKFTRWLRQKYSVLQLNQMGITNPETFNYKTHLKAQSPAVPVGADFAGWNGGVLKENFKTFLDESSHDFFIRLKGEVALRTGKDAPLSGNNTSNQVWNNNLMKAFDWGLSEMMFNTGTPQQIYSKSNEALKLNKFQVFSTPKLRYPSDFNADDTPKISDVDRLFLNRYLIAMSYASGGIMAVPWDVFEQSLGHGPDRFFGKKEDYADIYGFVRAMAPYLDDYEEVFALGQNLTTTNPVSDLISEIPAGVYVVVRVIPKSKTAPVIFHFVDTRAVKTPYTISVNSKVLYAGKASEMEFYRPKAYIPEQHTEAENLATKLRQTGKLFSKIESPAFNGLVDTVKVAPTTLNERISFDVPSVNPWGVLKVWPVVSK